MKAVSLDSIVTVTLTREGCHWYQKAWEGKAYINEPPQIPHYAGTMSQSAEIISHKFPHIRGDKTIDMPFGLFVSIFGETFQPLNKDHANHPMIEEYVIFDERDIVAVDGHGEQHGVEIRMSHDEAEQLIQLIVAFEDETGEDTSALLEIIEDATDMDFLK